MSSISHQLIKRLYWYKPATMQIVNVPTVYLEEYERLGMQDQLVHQCITEEDLTVQLRVLEQTEGCLMNPQPTVELIKDSIVGVIGYTMSAMTANGTRVATVESNAQNYAIHLINQHQPSRVVTSAVRGTDLFVAYEALQRGIELWLLTPKNYKQWSVDVLDKGWNQKSKDMLAELLTNASRIIEKDTSQKRKIEVINCCDVAFIQKDRKAPQQMYVRQAKTNNVPIVWFGF